MSLEAGQVFAGYAVMRPLGAGGMGAVYLVKHPRLPREEALKVLPPDLTTNAEYRARFLREADVAADLSHPHIVAIHDRGEYEGRFWISMDHVAGTDAAALLRTQYPGGIPVDEVASIIAAVGSALDYAHHRGLLHRDVKPANILLTEGAPRRAFLTDFGVARRVDDAAGLTATNTAVGTAAYAAPEQLLGQPLDGRADQYSLACTAFHLLAGSRPYDNSNVAVLIGQHITAPPPSLGARRPDLAYLDPVFATAMAKNPAERFASCQDFAAQLGRGEADPYLPPRPARAPRPRRRRTGRIAALLAVALLAIAGGLFAVLRPTQRPGSTATAGPLDGVYRTEFGPNIGIGDAPQPGAPLAIASSYGVRSVCGPDGCVATASRLSGILGPATMVLDEVRGTWLAVGLGTAPCTTAPAEFWQVLTLRPGPDGGLTGDYTESSGNLCAYKRSVTLTRTGDVDAHSVADPAAQRPRVPSPAEAFTGHYRSVRNYVSGSPQLVAEGSVATACLRTGERCMSYFHAQKAELPLIFGGDRWSLNFQQDLRCPGSDNAVTTKATGQYPLPQPTLNPLPQLAGHGHLERTGACDEINSDFDETLTRTGD